MSLETVCQQSFEGFVCLRLTDTPRARLTEELLATIEAKYVDKTRTHLLVHETGKDKDNPHIHATFALIGTVQAFRTALNRLGFKGNGCYRLEVADPKQMMSHFQYLCKGDGTGKEDVPNVGLRSEDLTDSVIDEAHQIYWQVSKELSERNPKRKREEPAAKQILAICVQKLEHDPSKLAISEDELIDITLEWYKANKWSMNVFQMKAVINYVSYSLNSNSNRVELMRQQLKFQ